MNANQDISKVVREKITKNCEMPKGKQLEP